MAEQTPSQPIFPRTSRRDFLRISALTAAAAASGLRPLGAREPELDSRSNAFPGRIVTFRDPSMNGHLATIDRDRVEQVVHGAVQVLAGVSETGPAFRSLLPGLTTTSRIAIKVNCIGPCDTRWETARAVVAGLAQMMGGAYDVSNVTVYDNQYVTAHGYTPSDFTFNGRTAVLSNTSNPGSYYVYGSHRLSSYIVDGQFVIDMPVIKCHTDTNNQITAALKNHYGSCTPSSLCGDTGGMLTVNADANIKGKTALVVLDCLRGTYTGGPSDPPQSWNLYPEHSPNTICVSTDPVTIDYWARDKINDERVLHGLSPKPCPWIEQASGAPYGLGVSNPAQMTMIAIESGAVDDGPVVSRGMLLLPPAPNPFRDRTVARFRLARPGTALLAIYAADGRRVACLRGEFDAGPGEMMWDGRDETGRPVTPGMYLMRLESAGSVSTRKVIRTQ